MVAEKIPELGRQRIAGCSPVWEINRARVYKLGCARSVWVSGDRAPIEEVVVGERILGKGTLVARAVLASLAVQDVIAAAVVYLSSSSYSVY